MPAIITGNVFDDLNSNGVLDPGDPGIENALTELDFGDAPEEYSTLLADNGPRHQIINQLTLGIQVTPELDGQVNATATGDDETVGIQDDGVSVPLPTLLTTDTAYSLTVDVINNTGVPANLYGWVDFNQNGIFQGNEAAPLQVLPSAPGVQQVILNFTVPVGVMVGTTFTRLRVTTDNLENTSEEPTSEDTRSLGPATDGEVEDYILYVEEQSADKSVVKTSSPDPVIAGEILTYTILVSNAGPSDAQNVTLTDVVPICILNPEYSLDGGITWNPWPGVINLGTIPSGGSVTVLIRGTVDPSCTGSITNTATVSSTTPDPDPTNDTSTVVTQITQLTPTTRGINLFEVIE